MAALAQPALTPRGGGLFRLDEDYTYEWVVSGLRRSLTIKAGFLTDIASVPPLFWALGFPPDGLHRAAAVLHDALYRARGILPSSHLIYRVNGVAVPARFTRLEADRLFGRMMREADVPQWRRRAMFRVVRAVSWAFW